MDHETWCKISASFGSGIVPQLALTGKEYKDDSPTPQEMIEREKAMIPAIVVRADDDERNSSVSDATIRETAMPGCTVFSNQRSMAGFKMEPSMFAKIQMACGKGGLSTAKGRAMLDMAPSFTDVGLAVTR